MSARDGAYNKCQPEHAPGGCVRRVASVSAEVSAEAHCRRRRGAHGAMEWRAGDVAATGAPPSSITARIILAASHFLLATYCNQSLRWLAALA